MDAAQGNGQTVANNRGDLAEQTALTTVGMPKPELKWKRILRALLDGNLNRFNAERHGDHCLNSTVADIQRDQLVSIAWIWEEVPSLGGRATARVKRYWVDRDPANLRRAYGVLGIAY